MTLGSLFVTVAGGRGAATGRLLRPSIGALLLVAAAGPACAAPPPAATAPRGAASAPQAQHPGDTAPAHAAPPAQDADAGSRSVAARARMSECGHQWNNMKRTGTATGTWKEFSRNCLAQK